MVVLYADAGRALFNGQEFFFPGEAGVRYGRTLRQSAQRKYHAREIANNVFCPAWLVWKDNHCCNDHREDYHFRRTERRWTKIWLVGKVRDGLLGLAFTPRFVGGVAEDKARKISAHQLQITGMGPG